MSVKSVAKLKALETKLTKAEAEYGVIDRQRKELEGKIADLKHQITQLKSCGNELKISEHAMLRYIERVVGIDLEEIREKILSREKRIEMNNIINGTYSVGEYKLKVADNTVVTVIAD